MAPQKIRLTKRSVEALKPLPSGSYVAWDTDARCFGVRVLASGTKTFVFQKHGRGALRIGRCDAITPDQARDTARKMLAKVERGEALPSRRTAAKAPLPNVPQTLRELWAWHQREIQPGLRPKSVASYSSLWRCHLAPMAGKLLTDFNRAMIEEWHRERSRVAGKIAANHAAVLLKLLLSFAERNSWLASNPARGIRKNKEHSRERFLAGPELARVLAILRASDLVVDKALEFLLLTGCRRGELLAMSWWDVDLEAGTWRKRAVTTKGGREQWLPLNPEAIELLSRLPRTNVLVFGLDRHGDQLHRRWCVVREEAGVPDVVLHDLRRSHATLLLAAGVDLVHVAKLLGHASTVITERYARAQEQSLREATKKVGAALSTVVAFRK
jgi:integrase